MEEQFSTAQKLINTLIEFCVNYSFQVLGAIIILIVGFVLSKWIGAFTFQLCSRKKLDITLSKFITSVVRTTVIAFAIIVALGKFGITIAPFVAALGAAAFGATYAIQGPLSNYGAGLSIILGRPFVVGDTVTIIGVSGIVHEVKLSCTILKTADGTTITIPNKHIVGEILYNSKGNRMAQGVIGISYDSDPEKAIQIITEVLDRFPEIQRDPAGSLVGIQQFADSSINISYLYWIPTENFFPLTSAVNLAVLKALQASHIEIPFPQRDVHIISQTQSLGAK